MSLNRVSKVGSEKVFRALMCPDPVLRRTAAECFARGQERVISLGRALGKALKRPVIVVLASRFRRCKLETETALQETAHSARTISLDNLSGGAGQPGCDANI
jgi:hypothetical protein